MQHHTPHSGVSRTPSRSAVTQILQRVSEGDSDASGEIITLLYPQLHQLALRKMRGEASGSLLQPTALVSELYIGLVTRRGKPIWPSRRHFLGWVSKAMENLLRDHARRRSSQRAGGHVFVLTLEESRMPSQPVTNDGVLDILDAVQELAAVRPRMGAYVRMRMLVGCSYAEIAKAHEVSVKTVERSLQAARSWLRCRLRQ